MKRIFIPLVVVVLCSLALGAQHKLLSGTYRLSGQTFYDPPEREAQDTHVYFQLTGASARDLYNTMKVGPIAEVCGDAGAKTKVIGGMQCTRSARGTEYRCWFGLDVANQRIVNGVVC
jgi:hypothetical protein